MMTSPETQKLSPSTDSLVYPMTPPQEALQVQMPTNFFFACDSIRSHQPNAFGTLQLDALQPSLFGGDSSIESMSQQWSIEDLLMPLMVSARPPSSIAPKMNVQAACTPRKKLKIETTRHECSECPASFAGKHHLKRHSKKHNGASSYGCSVPGCRVASHRSDNMAKHIITHQKRLAKQKSQRAKFMAARGTDSILVTPQMTYKGQDVLSIDPEAVSPTTFFNGIMAEYYPDRYSVGFNGTY
jgi:uncharacterized Zn-finger protein